MTANDATLRQISAADPAVSTWLSANAGSGKTRVLTDRVARLLLRRVSPQNILCLTYTKAAATEMQNRLFRRLGEWAMKGDEALRAELRELGVEETLSPGDLAHARTLFARAIETPGGLKIQTIHSFCASLLRRFPMEAGVSPFFREIDDRSAKLLREEVVEDLASGPHLPVIEALARHYTGEDLDGLTAELVRRREALLAGGDRATIWTAFDLPPGFARADLSAQLLLGGEAGLLTDLCTALARSEKVTDQRAAKLLSAVSAGGPTLEDFELLASVFLTGSGAKQPFSAKIGSFPTKDLRSQIATILDRLEDFMQRVEAARPLRNQLFAAERSAALYDFAGIFLPEYAARKEQRGWLDFDDLIIGARKLLTNPVVAEWVLFRLDGGIDHILVDEAQDTSPEQWRVIELLAEEFTTGKGARDGVERTIFVVGDLKQSIYSFQGADPRAFDQMRQHFESRLQTVGRELQRQSLDYSFRSSRAVLELVDATFRTTGGRGLGGVPLHLAFHAALPGRVDHWPVVPKSEGPEDREWYDPTDKIAQTDARVVLANKIAEEIDLMIKTGSVPGGNGAFRKITAGDFLILVQRRSRLFHEIIRACKSKGLDVAGADRLKVGAELAVQDLTALLRFLATPDDDLSLASVLRSPIIGLTEGQLYDLAHTRSETRLWQALRRRKSDFPEAHETLYQLRNQADFLAPYELIERILTRFGGRLRLLARLGDEAEDGIDAMLSLAMSYETTETPSLTGFLTWMETDEVEIKRQSDAAGDRIRVMTTHGAKGLESPIVILPDTADRTIRHRDDLIQPDGLPPLWKTRSDQMPEAMAGAMAVAKTAQDEERMRLLYVALTRAERWLIVCGCGETGKDPGNWHGLVEAGMIEAGAMPLITPAGIGLRLQHGDWAEVERGDETANAGPREPLPLWLTTRADPPADRPATLAPSGLGGAKVMPGEAAALDTEAAMERGTHLHRLLEHLPEHPRDNWPNLARALLSVGEVAVPSDLADDILAEAQAVLGNPDLEYLFGSNSLAEVPVSASLPELAGARINGAIDRLVIRADSVLAIDFKSNAVIPQDPLDVPLGLLKQMGAYASALGQIYPGKRVDVAILWTRTATLMPLPHDIVRQALHDTSTS